MTGNGLSQGQSAVRACQEALRRVCVLLPHLAGLARQVRLQADGRVATIGVFASGRLVLNPEFILALAPLDQVFVLAHELLHLALDTHGRGQGSNAQAVNIAHDLIINDILEEALRREPPAGGLRRCGARQMALETLLADLRTRPLPRDSWQWGGSRRPPPAHGALGQALLERARDEIQRGQPAPPFRALAGLHLPASDAQDAKPPPEDGPSLDVLSNTQERQWYPEARPRTIARQRVAIRAAAAKANSLCRLFDTLDQLEATSWGNQAGDYQATMDALRHAYPPPWELALQHWFDAQTATARSFARPSRRGADRTDLVRPGRQRAGWVLHLVLDTSGSMGNELPAVLGMITAFGAAASVSQVHVLQCDVKVTADDWLEPEELERYPIHGFGGSNLSPALARLADDPAVEAVVVVTDGFIVYPAEPPPFAVLWAVVNGDNPYFHPPYGQVIALPNRSEE